MGLLLFLDDIESDFSVFHRVDDVCTMPAPRFFKFAWRLMFYEGAMRGRMLALAEKSEAAARPAPQPTNPNAVTPPPITPESVRRDPLLAGLISFGHA